MSDSEASKADPRAEIVRSDVIDSVNDPMLKLRQELESTRTDDSLNMWDRRRAIAEAVRGMARVRRETIAQATNLAENAVRQQAELFRVGFQDMLLDLIKLLQDNNLITRYDQHKVQVLKIEQKMQELAPYSQSSQKRALASLEGIVTKEWDNFDFMADEVAQNCQKRIQERYRIPPLRVN